MRGEGKRTWIKLYPRECLFGSIRFQLDSAERGVWYDLLNFSALCVTPGHISDSDARPFPHSFIANRLNVQLELLESTLSKCIDEGRIKENSNGLTIVNWAAYQSEYQRQKPYRQAGLKPEPTAEQLAARETQQRVTEAKLKRRRELGRPLTATEIKELNDEVSGAASS